MTAEAFLTTLTLEGARAAQRRLHRSGHQNEQSATSKFDPLLFDSRERLSKSSGARKRLRNWAVGLETSVD
jgi:hypothetical protein